MKVGCTFLNLPFESCDKYAIHIFILWCFESIYIFLSALILIEWFLKVTANCPKWCCQAKSDVFQEVFSRVEWVPGIRKDPAACLCLVNTPQNGCCGELHSESTSCYASYFFFLSRTCCTLAHWICVRKCDHKAPLCVTPCRACVLGKKQSLQFRSNLLELFISKY